MKLEQLQRKLIAAARANPPEARVPYAFEKRILARLNQSGKPDLAAQWARALWRAASLCVVLTLSVAAWSFFGEHDKADDAAASVAGASATEFSQYFQQTMLAAVNQSEDVQ